MQRTFMLSYIPHELGVQGLKFLAFGGSAMERYVIKKQDLLHNIQLIQAKAGTIPVWAVVKGNAYGLGLQQMVPLFCSQGIDRFCVSELHEAQLVRSLAGSSVSILMLQPSSDPAMLAALIELDVICSISSWENAIALNQTALSLGKMASAHLKIDTGMGRYGFAPEQWQQISTIFTYFDAVSIIGTYTHFAAACNRTQTMRQHSRFSQLLEQLRSAGCNPGECHCCNSAAFLLYPQLHMDGVRIGSAWLGRMADSCKSDLRRIGRCESQVVELHHLAPGCSTGYGSTWTAVRPTTLAILPVGWYHGFGTQRSHPPHSFRSCLSEGRTLLRTYLRHSGPTVELNGQQCPIRGRIGMYHTAVDVTSLSCHVGDTAYLDLNPLMQKGLPIILN